MDNQIQHINVFEAFNIVESFINNILFSTNDVTELPSADTMELWLNSALLNIQTGSIRIIYPDNFAQERFKLLETTDRLITHLRSAYEKRGDNIEGSIDMIKTIANYILNPKFMYGG